MCVDVYFCSDVVVCSALNNTAVVVVAVDSRHYCLCVCVAMSLYITALLLPELHCL